VFLKANNISNETTNQTTDSSPYQFAVLLPFPCAYALSNNSSDNRSNFTTYATSCNSASDNQSNFTTYATPSNIFPNHAISDWTSNHSCPDIIPDPLSDSTANSEPTDSGTSNPLPHWCPY
jgi:hypothetical protein